MIIYDKRKPKTFDGTNCVGITGENLAETQEFLIRGMYDITVDYFIHLRFADGSVNSVIPDSTAIDETGTKLVWKVRKNDIFMHGYFELQLEGRGENGYVFQTQIVTLYADESIPIEDKEYLNPNSETLKLREETQKLLDETKLCRTEIDKTKKLIEQSDITKKEDHQFALLCGYSFHSFGRSRVRRKSHWRQRDASRSASDSAKGHSYCLKLSRRSAAGAILASSGAS